jgi:toxin CcdB
MAQFDVLRLKSGDWVIDCQTDLLDGISTRFVVPLALPEDAPPVRPRLNPIFDVAGERRVMVTQFAGAIALPELAGKITSLSAEEYTIRNALDMLLSGV